MPATTFLRRLIGPLALRSRYRALRPLVPHLGAVGAIQFYRHASRGNNRSPHPTYALRAKAAAHPLRIRTGTSDLSVFQQIFIAREYGCLDDITDVRLIVDCGANAGYTSAYFLSRWPAAELIAVEPDPANFAALRANLAPYGRRARAIQAAVWTGAGELSPADDDFRPELHHREWCRQFRASRPDDAVRIAAVDIPTLLAQSGHERISILKMDIEGAEAVVFDGPCDWLDAVDNLAIELHDDTAFGNASAAFRKAIAGRPFDVETSGELTLCRRRDRAS